MPASRSPLGEKGKGSERERKWKRWPARWVTPAFTLASLWLTVTWHWTRPLFDTRSTRHVHHERRRAWWSASDASGVRPGEVKVTSRGAICSSFDCLTGGPLLMGLCWSKCKQGGEWWCCLKSGKLNCCCGSDGKIRDCQGWIPTTPRRTWLGNLALGFMCSRSNKQEKVWKKYEGINTLPGIKCLLKMRKWRHTRNNHRRSANQQRDA